VSTSTDQAEIGIIVDAGPILGYGHAVRCLRLAHALEKRNSVVFYPLSDTCKTFIEAAGFPTTPSFAHVPPASFPRLVITDLREAHGITAAIHRYGSRHISIHDLGLAQCQSDVVIDGSITRLFPFTSGSDRSLYLGPKYMMTRAPVARDLTDGTVLITLGGGRTSRYAQTICEHVSNIGLKPVVTYGFSTGARAEAKDSSPATVHSAVRAEPVAVVAGCDLIQTEEEIARAMSSCCFAMSGSGLTLYDLLASGVPTIALAFDHLQLRTADAFQELGAVLSAGLLERLSPVTLLRCCSEMLENRALGRRIAQAGQSLVDGKGLSRVVDIVRRQLWLTNQVKTFTRC
jgi:spore coat polysaccharide biosynthesis predicted glycosyltransferase SpsG